MAYIAKRIMPPALVAVGLALCTSLFVNFLATYVSPHFSGYSALHIFVVSMPYTMFIMIATFTPTLTPTVRWAKQRWYQSLIVSALCLGAAFAAFFGWLTTLGLETDLAEFVRLSSWIVLAALWIAVLCHIIASYRIYPLRAFVRNGRVETSTAPFWYMPWKGDVLEELPAKIYETVTGEVSGMAYKASAVKTTVPEQGAEFVLSRERAVLAELASRIVRGELESDDSLGEQYPRMQESMREHSAAIAELTVQPVKKEAA